MQRHGQRHLLNKGGEGETEREPEGGGGRGEGEEERKREKMNLGTKTWVSSLVSQRVCSAPSEYSI